MEHISNDKVCVNYAFYNAMSIYNYYSLDFDEVVDLYQVSLDFTAYLSTSVKKSKNYFFYFGCLLVKNYLNGHQSLDVVVQEFVSDHRYVDCPTGDLLKLCCNHQKIIDMGDFCAALQQYLSRKNNISNQDSKAIEWMLDNFYDQAKIIVRFYKKRFLEFKAKFGRQHDDNDHGFLECLTDLIQREQKSLKYLGLVASHLSDWIKETQNPVSKKLMADMAFEYLNRIVCHHPYLLKSRSYQFSESDADYIVPLLNMLKFFEPRQACSFLATIVETAEYSLELRLECAFLLLDFFDERHQLLASLMNRRFFSETPEKNVYFPCTRVGRVESFTNEKIFSIDDLLLLYKKNPQDYQEFEALRHKISNDYFKSEAIEKFSEFIEAELDQLFALADGKEKDYNDLYFGKLVDLLFSNKNFDSTKIYQKMIDVLVFLHQKSFGENIKSAIVSLIYRNEFFVPEIYRYYLNDWQKFILRMADSKMSVEELCQRFVQCGMDVDPTGSYIVSDFFTGLDRPYIRSTKMLFIPRKNVEIYDLFGGFFYDFFGLDFEFFQYDQSLNISEGVVLVNEYKALESWSDFLNFYTIGVSGKRYSFFVYQSFGDYQLLTDIFLLFLKFYNSSVSLYYISHEYGYNSYCEFFGADELLFDQLIEDIDYPCRKVKFFEPLQPTTEFWQIESELNKVISDQGFYSIIQPDHFVDLSKQMRGTSRDQADWLVSMIPEMQARASLPSEDTFTQALQVRNLFVALAREMIYDKRWVNQLNGLKPLWTREHAVTQMSSRDQQSSDGSLPMILEVFFDADGLLNDLK